MSTAAPFEIGSLLEQAGAKPRGNRHNCPKCGGLRTITRTDECFYCHKCQWKGNAVSLAKELGLYQRLSPAEYRGLRQERERADRNPLVDRVLSDWLEFNRQYGENLARDRDTGIGTLNHEQEYCQFPDCHRLAAQECRCRAVYCEVHDCPNRREHES